MKNEWFRCVLLSILFLSSNLFARSISVFSTLGVKQHKMRNAFKCRCRHCMHRSELKLNWTRHERIFDRENNKMRQNRLGETGIEVNRVLTKIEIEPTMHTLRFTPCLETIFGWSTLDWSETMAIDNRATSMSWDFSSSQVSVAFQSKNWRVDSQVKLANWTKWNEREDSVVIAAAAVVVVVGRREWKLLTSLEKALANKSIRWLGLYRAILRFAVWPQ